MKACPKCGRRYADDYNFCLLDGTFLSEAAQDPNKTEVLPRVVVPDSVPTVERRDPVSSNEPLPTIAEDSMSVDEPLPTVAVIPPRPAPYVPRPPVKNDNVEIAASRRRKLVILWNIGAVVVLMIMGTGFVAGILYETVDLSRLRGTTAANSNVPVQPAPSPTLKATVEPTVSPSPTATPTPRPTPSPTPTQPISIPNPEPTNGKTFPDPDPPDLTGRYYLRMYQGDDSVIMHFDVFDQRGPDFSIRDVPDKLNGTAHLDFTDRGSFMGYVIWENQAGETDREDLYICADNQGLCGKLPFQSWYFVATKRPGEEN